MSTAIAIDADFTLFIAKFKKKSGIDLSLYKESQMKRRLIHLKDRRDFSTFTDYYYAIEKDLELYQELLEYMTINVSEFFRNAQRWGILEKRVIPELLLHSPRLKCWSAACSTGEEPYSLAMLLSTMQNTNDLQVLATDLDKQVIEMAKAGRYKAELVKNVPKPYLNKFFSIQGKDYVISEEIKKSVKFRAHNLLADPFESQFDLIICRNVLIYFTEETKELLFEKFSKSLRKGGYLFIGGSEQIVQPQKYQLVQEETFFFRKQ
jgi:chemotaxis protein methyltransferase CheR